MKLSSIYHLYRQRSWSVIHRFYRISTHRIKFAYEYAGVLVCVRNTDKSFWLVAVM